MPICKSRIAKCIVDIEVTERPMSGRVNITDINDILEAAWESHSITGALEGISVGDQGAIVLKLSYEGLAQLSKANDDHQMIVKVLIETWASEEAALLDARGVA